jgi:hypothetical protein
VKLRVEDGFDLDQYLFASSSPINFNLDLQGFKPDPVKPTVVTLRVFDVDQQGAPPDCSAEVDRVLVNGTYLGNLTGANSQWSIVSFSIPPGTLTTGVNRFEVQIDTLGTGCWAVEVDYAEVEMPFNLAQIEASATDDVTIRRGKTDDVITDPIWKRSFDASGNLSAPDPNDPIADAINSTSWIFFSSNEFTYKYKIGTWPTGSQPTFQPRVEYEWEIGGTGVKSPSAQELTGWENSFKVKMPGAIGRYDLKVTLKIYRDQELLGTENRTHTLYALLNDPVSPASNPRTAWLDYATDWAKGKDKPEDALDALNAKEYSNPLGWGYGYPKVDMFTLIENGAGKNGDCFVFRDVLQLLGASLGIATSKALYAPSGGFMTSNRPALDGNASANSRNKATLARDRWTFSNHQVISFGSQLYDPTFGLKSPNKEVNVFCKISGIAPDGRYICTTLSPPPARALLRLTAGMVNGWDIVEYETFTTLANAATQNPFAPTLQVSPAFPATVQSADVGVDQDDNGLFEFLKVDVQVNVATAGRYAVNTVLQAADGDVLGIGSVTPVIQTNSPQISLGLPSGTQTVTVYFSGFAIRSSSNNGPYTATVSLNNEAGATLGPVSHTTQPYSFTDFQGMLADVQSVSDQGVSTDEIAGYDVLRTSLVLNVLAESNFNLHAQLFKGSAFLGSVSRQLHLLPGLQSIQLNFPGAPIAVSGQNGPYTLYLSLSDSNYTNDWTHSTQAYLAQDFQLPVAVLDSTFADVGSDLNGNGKYEALTISGNAAALVTGTYTLQGILQSSTGSFIGAAQNTYTLDNTPKPVALNFDGRTINLSGLDGPYNVLMTLVYTNGNTVSGRQYTTTAYAATDFESPLARFTGVYTDAGLDTNANTFFNQLRIGMSVAVSETSNYTIEGTLQDNAGNFIVSAVTSTLLTTGVQTVNLAFDGQAIWLHGVNGPYRLVGLSLRHATSGTVNSVISAYSTSAYERNEFEPFGLVFNGNFTDRGQDINGNVLFDWLVIDRPISVTQAGTYNMNARLVDANGIEIVWTSVSRFFSAGPQTATLQFDGRQIYGNGIDGPYFVRDLSIYNGSGSVSINLAEAHTTSAYDSEAFERSGVVSGTVKVGANPLPNATVYIAGNDISLTDNSGAYRLAVPITGTYQVEINANPNLAPWQINVNGQPVTVGLSTTVAVSVGVVTVVDFSSTTTNTAPSVNAGADVSGSEGSAVALSGSASDVDANDSLTLTWSYAPGPGTDPDASCSFANPSAATTTLTCTDEGTYTATLSANDGTNPFIRDSTQVNLVNAVPIVAPIVPTTRTVNVGDEVVLGPVSFSDLGVIDTHVAVWNWGDSTTTTVAATGNSVGSSNHIYNTPGTYTPTLTVTDSDGGASQITTQVVVRGIPYAYAGRRISGVEGTAIALGASTSASEAATNSSTTWQWRYARLSGAATTVCMFSNSAGAVSSLMCSDNGTFSVTVTLTDTSNGLTSLSDSTVVTVVNASPVVSAPVPLAGTVPMTYYAGTNVRFGDVRFTDSGTNDTHSVEWRWGDGLVSAGTISSGLVTAMQHVYQNTGTYTVRVAVTDDDGATGIGEAAIVVLPPVRRLVYLPFIRR